MRLHLLGIPHTVSNEEHSHCAYTGKVVKFPKMMRPFGYEIVHYGVEGAETEATEHVTIMSRAKQNRLRGHEGSDPTRFVGDDANIENPLYRAFNIRLRKELIARVGKNDLVLMPFGWAHAQAVDGLGFKLVESGIGYPALYPGAPFRIYESYAWLHFHQGKEDRNGKNYEWVVPNYFDLDAWDVELEPPKDTVVYLGRINDLKGLRVVVEVAKHRPDLTFTICGQGDPAPYLGLPNLHYLPPLTGRARSAYLGRARAVLMPSAFTEPFGGVAVEAQLCGTPVLTPDFGAFTETVESGVSGFRCHTLGDYLAGVEESRTLDRRQIADRARARYGLAAVGALYDNAFRMIDDLRGAGWYSMRSRYWQGMAPPAEPTPDARAWAAAQVQERKFHVEGLQYRAAEGIKRAAYAQLMGIGSVPHGRVLDIGCGPESLLLVTPHGEGSAGLDPLRFSDTDETRYADAGITRFIQPAEEPLPDEAGTFDEAWVYNCLQHTMDPAKVLANLRGRAKVVRLYEWCNIPADTLHLHVLTADEIREWMTKGWTVVSEHTGHMSDNERQLHGDYYCAVFVEYAVDLNGTALAAAGKARVP